MKKLKLPAFYRLAIYMAVTVIPFNLFAQNADLNPDGWQAFVESKKNCEVLDTFLVQTFNGTPEDNWGYKIMNNAEVFDAKSVGIRNASEGMSLKLKPGANVIFDNTVQTPLHKGVMLLIPFAVHDLMPGENMHIIKGDGRTVVDKQYIKIPSDHYTYHFQEEKEGANRKFASITDGGVGFYNFQIQISDSSDHSANGFYAFDSVCGRRTIKAYTLFSGSGNWQESTRWSHHPATRNRHALICGDVAVSDNIQCDSLMLGKGSVHVEAGNHLFVRELFLNGTDVSLSVAGDIHVKDRICYQLTLPETGQWYFVSFPFDVSVEGMDPGFQLGDEETEATGNFFYLKTYDGIQRSTTNRAVNNWKTVPATAGQEGEPVFRKGQGYLIALDEKANRKKLQFSAKHDRLPAGFGREGSVSIKVSPASGDTDDEHRGWILCGNPLPAPLPLSAIETNTDLDGYVYMYDGHEFQAYPIGSKEVLPPLSAFFVKAKQDTELKIRSTGLVTKAGSPTYSLSPFRTAKEPAVSSITTNPSISGAPVPFRLTDGGIQVIGLLSPASLSVFDLTGSMLVKQSLSAGSSFVPLSLPAGFYILQIQQGNDRTQYKVVWDK